MKYGKASIQVKFYYMENKVFQHFSVIDTRMRKYVLDNRFVLGRMFDDFVNKNALSNIDSDYTFVTKKNYDDKVTLEFSFEEGLEKERINTYFHTLAGNIPFSTGCEDCKYFKEGMYCEKKDKVLNNKLKTCRFFSQKESET